MITIFAKYKQDYLAFAYPESHGQNEILAIKISIRIFLES